MTIKTAILLLVTAAAAAAQQSSGYFFFAPGGVTNRGYTSMTLHVGAGADLMIAKGIGANVEIGALGPREDFSGVVGVFSPGGTYYFRRGKELKLEPFVAGGYSLMFRYGNESLAYFGGGVNYWFHRVAGLRLELRDHLYPSTCSSCSATHFWGIRMALALR